MNTEQAQHLVTVAARRYARKCWWADPDDLRQVGHLAVVQARRTYDLRVGVTPVQYYWRAILFSMSRYLWKESAPVSGGGHRPELALKGCVRASLDDPAVGPRQVDALTPEDRVEDARWLARVQAQLGALAREDGAGGANVLAVLLEHAPAQELADVRGTRLHAIYRATSELRRRVSNDEALYELMRERR